MQQLERVSGCFQESSVAIVPFDVAETTHMIVATALRRSECLIKTKARRSASGHGAIEWISTMTVFKESLCRDPAPTYGALLT